MKAVALLSWMRDVMLVGLGALVLGSAAAAQGSGYWHTSGNLILDANNQRVRIAGVNWYGFETTEAVAHGLTSQDYKAVLAGIKANGYNTVRIPLSNQMVETPGTGLNVSDYNSTGPINAELKGLNSLQVLDKIVSAAGLLGLKVILDNHRSEAGNSAEASGLWYTGAYPESAWIQDWTALANRYNYNPTVIGFDLRNEPHNAASGGACWDCGGANDWHLAAERAGNAVLAVNPGLLIFVEGTDAYANDYYWWGGNLEGVANSPVVLNVANQLVYSAHDYGPREYQQTWFNAGTTYGSLSTVWNQHWAYISANNLAPVWLGEFGTTNVAADISSSVSGSQGQWFQSLTGFLNNDASLNWTYWALNGEDSYGLLDSNYDAAPVSAQKQAALAAIQSTLSSGVGTTQPPDAPSGMTAVAASSSEVDLSWTAGATSGAFYTVYFGTSPNPATVLVSGTSAPTFAATGLNASTLYYFDVVAVTSAGTSAASNVASATTQAATVSTPTVPVAPPGLFASPASASAINLQWQASSTAGATYTVYFGTASGVMNNIAASGLSSTAYSVGGLSDGTAYYFVVKAVAQGSASAASNQASATTQTLPSAPPTSVSATAVSSSEIALSWSAVPNTGATYGVYIGTQSGSTNTLVASGIGSTSFTVSGLAASTTYYFTLRSTSAGGNSAPSTQASATTLAAAVTPPPAAPATPDAPTALTAATSSSTQIDLAWTASPTSGVTYNVYSGGSVIATGVSATTYSATGLAASTAYSFTVAAANGSSVSAMSNTASATTQAAPAGECHVSYGTSSDWGAGFTGVITIANTSAAAINGWKLTWSYAGNQQLYQSWDGDYTQAGQAVSIVNANWNSNIPAGGSQSGIGFNANYSGANVAPTAFYLNGVACK